MDLVKCPRCGEDYSPSYRRCPFCEEGDYPRKVKNKMRSGRRVSEKKKTYSGRSALVIILLLVLALLTWVLFGEKIIARFAKPDESEPPVEDVIPSTEVNDDPFYDPSVGDGTGADTNTDVSNAQLSSEDFTLSVGESTQLTVTGTDAAVTWSSKDSAVAVVDSSGLVTAVDSGTTTITAVVGEKTLEAIVQVREASLNRVDITLNTGESFQLKVKDTDASVAWSIDDSNIASISANGVVKGSKPGKTNAHAKVGGKTLTCVVRIK